MMSLTLTTSSHSSTRLDYKLRQLVWLSTAFGIFHRGTLTAWVPFVKVRKGDREHALNCGTAVSGLYRVELLAVGDDARWGQT